MDWAEVRVQYYNNNALAGKEKFQHFNFAYHNTLFRGPKAHVALIELLCLYSSLAVANHTEGILFSEKVVEYTQRDIFEW